MCYKTDLTTAVDVIKNYSFAIFQSFSIHDKNIFRFCAVFGRQLEKKNIFYFMNMVEQSRTTNLTNSDLL